MDLDIFSHWIFWMIAAVIIRMVRSFYLEFKIGELLGHDLLETRMLDAVRKEMERSHVKPNLFITFPLVALMIVSSYWLPSGENAVVFLFVGIVLSGLEVLKEFEERRALRTAVLLQPVLWRLHVLTGVGFVLNVISAYQFSAIGMK